MKRAEAFRRWFKNHNGDPHMVHFQGNLNAEFKAGVIVFRSFTHYNKLHKALHEEIDELVAQDKPSSISVSPDDQS